MRFRYEPANQLGWNNWFAWHPVFVEGYVVWLETVKRKYWSGGLMYDDCWIYLIHHD